MLKLVKHCSENLPDGVQGRLLGFDPQNGVLEVTNCYPSLLRGAAATAAANAAAAAEDEYDDAAAAAAAAASGEEDADVQYTLEMVKGMRSVHFDSLNVGWYTSCSLGNFVNSLIVDTQEVYQQAIARSVVLVYDPVQSSVGKLSLRAFRLSKAFLENRESVSYEHLLEEVPVEITNPLLVKSYLADLSSDSLLAGLPSFDSVDLSTKMFLERTMESMLEKMEDLSIVQRRLQAISRNNRRRQYAEDDDEAPSRLEAVLLASQIDVLAAQTDQFVNERFNLSASAGTAAIAAATAAAAAPSS